MDRNLTTYTMNMGFRDTNDLILKFVMPVIIAATMVFFVLIVFFPHINFVISIGIYMFGLSMIFLYPMVALERKKKQMDETMHFFITYAGTLATMKINRGILFQRIAQKKVFGELSNISEKILYLSKKWTLGYSRTCRKVGKMVPSKTFADFLDRFAVMMDFGEDLETFLVEEQDSVMDDFSVEYKKSLEVIKLMQDIFTSLTITLAFGMAVALLMPLLMGISITVIIRWALFAILIMDTLMIVFIKSFIPVDKLCNDLGLNPEINKIKRYFWIFLGVGILVFAVLIVYTRIPFLLTVALAASPLLIVGFLAKREEQTIFRRDSGYPTFIRTLGAAVDIRSGAIVSSLAGLRVHDFGYLNKMMINLYRRLKLGMDKVKSWLLFSGESGSNLIFHFSKIFSESVYMGGNAEKIGEIISRNFLRILSLRKLRMQLASGLRGALYGSLIGFAATTYIIAEIIKVLAKIFSQPFSGGTETVSLSNLLGSTAPNSALGVNMATVTIYVGIMVAIHSIISAIILKLVDGGLIYTSLLDFVLMLFIGAAISVAAPQMIKQLLPELDEMANEGVSEGGEAISLA